MNHAVNIENTYQGYMIEIKAFGYHLGTNQQVNSPIGKIINQLIEGVFSLRCILVHTRNFVFGKQ